MLLFINSITIFSSEKNLANAFKFFKKGAYPEAISELSKIKRGSEKLLGTKFYLEGMCHNRSQRFDLAATSFKNALAYQNSSKDIYYEFGQALFANSDLEKARKIFLKSAKQDYKKPMSLYYVAHISQILEEHQVAKNTYFKLLKHQKELPNELKNLRLAQTAQFQLSESLLALAEAKNHITARNAADEKIIPLMEKSIAIMPKAPIVTDIEKRIKDIKKKYFLDPDLMKNGKILRRPRWKLSFSQEAAYDSNVTLATNQVITQQTLKDSYIHNSTLSSSYTGQLANRYILRPYFKLKNTTHGDRTNSTVFTNDSYKVSSGLKTSREHTLFGNKASLLLDLDYNYIAQDRDSVKERRYFSRDYTLTLGEKFKLFSFGNTGIKLKYQDYYGYLNNLNKRTKTIAIDQLYITKKGRILIFFFSGDFADHYNNITNSIDTLLFRVDWVAPNFWPDYTLNLAMSVTFTDTKLQQATRGTEKTYNPSIKITKKVNDKISLTAGYSYTRNESLDLANFDYKKHVTNFEFKYDF